MSKVYLPTAEQMDTTLEHLSKIAGAMGDKIYASTWKGVQNAVRAGLAPRLFPIGTQFKVSHTVYGDMLYDVVAHDYFKSANDENAHTMTLMCHDIVATVQYDNIEAFYYAESELPIGTYNFTLNSTYRSWAAGTYQFTLTKPLPKGGQLEVSGDADKSLTTLMTQAYSNQTTTTVSEMCAITAGNGGTNLGTFGKELNHTQRVSHGSSNYKESAIRQFLNSSAIAGSVWAPQTKFDRPPTWVNSTAGFANGLDADFLSVVGKVVVPCSANNEYESSDSTVIKGAKYTVTDKFYLASQQEIFGVKDNTLEDDSVLFPFYKDAVNADRIKYRSGSAMDWWLRSAFGSYAYDVRIVFSDGNMRIHGARGTCGCVPVCTIV